MRKLLLAIGAALIFGSWSVSAWMSQPMLMMGKSGSPPPPPPGTQPCAIGQPYIGNVPAGANAAGFTTCALNIDMSQSYYQTLSNWLDCSADASGAKTPAVTPIMWNFSQHGANTGGFTENCDNTPPPYTFVNDGGVPALKIEIPAASGTGVGRGAGMDTVNPITVAAGQLFPVTVYLEVRYRLDASSNSVCQNTVSPANSQSCTPFTVFPYIDPRGNQNGNAQQWVEWDFIETFVSSSFGALTGKAPNAYHGPSLGAVSILAPAEYSNTGQNDSSAVGVVADLTQYHTFGIRLVADGAPINSTTNGNVTWCMYHDGIQDVCEKGVYNNGVGSTSDIFATRLLYNLQNYANPSMNNTGPMISYLTNYSIWLCSGALAAPLTQVGNTCYNSTADVTGRLAGTP